ncbi:MAG: hypothetical protein ACOH13_12680 [Flavobacteriales bacterium]
MATVKMGVIRLAATALVAKAQGLYDKMLASIALYPSPVPTLLEFQQNIDALAAANATVDANGGKAAHQAKREALNAVKGDIKMLAGYVQTTSAGVADKILLSGFEVVRRGSPKGELSPPLSLTARATKMERRASFTWKCDQGADVYQVFMSRSNDPFQWELLGTTTKRGFNADNLESGVLYWFAVSAVGAAGETSKSEPLLARAA